MGYYRFIVPNGRKFKAGERSMNITFSVKEDGQLYVNAEPPEDEQDFCQDTNQSVQMWLLFVLFLAIFALYIALKVSNLNEEQPP